MKYDSYIFFEANIYRVFFVFKKLSITIYYNEYCIDLKTGLKILIINDSTNLNIKIILHYIC